MNKREKVYLKAAKKIVKGDEMFCCIALPFDSEERETFKKYFKGREGAYGLYGDYTKPQNQLARSLALLFMAELDK